MRSHRTRHGFTLIELLAVIALILVLLSLLAPMMGVAYQKAYTAVCQANIRSMSTAAALYTGDHDGLLPYRWSPVWIDVLAQGGYVSGATFLCPTRVKKDQSATSTISNYGYSDWLEWSGSGSCPKRMSLIPKPPQTPFIADCDNYRFLRIYDWQVWFWPVSRHSPSGPIDWQSIGGYNANDSKQAAATISIGWGDGHSSLPSVAELLQNPNWGQIFQGCP